MVDDLRIHISRATALWISLVVLFLCTINAVAKRPSIALQQFTIRKRPSELLYGHFGHGTFCNIQGQQIHHGHFYHTSKCLKSQCFMGTIFMYSEGCEDSQGLCHDVNSEWVENCVTFTCRKTASGGFKYYQPIVVNALCRDHYGVCHEPGKFFQFRLGPHVHPKCQCNVSKEVIYYRCYAG